MGCSNIEFFGFRPQLEEMEKRGVIGSGLGLSIVKHGVMAHNGQIRVDSTLGRGTTMEVIFDGI